MINIQHTPTENFENYYTVEADSIDEVLNELLPKIRRASQDFYKNNLTSELKKKGSAIVDHHAGNGIFYAINLIAAVEAPQIEYTVSHLGGYYLTSYLELSGRGIKQFTS